MKTSEAAKGKWVEILRYFGVPERIFTKKHQPCIFGCGSDGGGKDRFRFINSDGDGNFICNRCGGGDAMTLLQKFTGKPFREIAREIDKIVGNLKPEKPQPKPNMSGKIHLIRKLAVKAGACPEVVAYLKGRGVKPSKYVKAVPSLKYYQDGKLISEFSAMVVPFVSREGKLLTWHVTYIKGGQKAGVSSPRKMLTPISKLDGGALRLTDIYPEIGIAEGVETALAVMRDYNIPCWAAYSAGTLEKFRPPEGVTTVKIFGDNDESFTGQRAAYILGYELKRLGYTTTVYLPDRIGDFADKQ